MAVEGSGSAYETENCSVKIVQLLSLNKKGMRLFITLPELWQYFLFSLHPKAINKTMRRVVKEPANKWSRCILSPVRITDFTLCFCLQLRFNFETQNTFTYMRGSASSHFQTQHVHMKRQRSSRFQCETHSGSSSTGCAHMFDFLCWNCSYTDPSCFHRCK